MKVINLTWVFVPLAGKSWLRAIWVEAKARKLGLSDQDFQLETCEYLKRWLAFDRETRFKFMVFAKDLASPSKWMEVWDKDLSKDRILEWLKASKPGRDKVAGHSTNDLVSFFSECDVDRGDTQVLRASTKARAKLGAAAMENETTCNGRCGRDEHEPALFRRGQT